jgi:hypothetical protein
MSLAEDMGAGLPVQSVLEDDHDLDSESDMELTKADLDMVEQIMLEKIEQADPGLQHELLTMAQSQPVSHLTQLLSQRYPGYARFFTEDYVTRILAVAMHELAVDNQDRGHDIALTIGHDPDGATEQRNPDYDHSPNTEYILDAVAMRHDQDQDAGNDSYLAATRHEKSNQLLPDTKKSHTLLPVQESGQPLEVTHRERIKAVIQKSQAEERTMTYQQIADEAVVGRSTVKKYARTILQELLGS